MAEGADRIESIFAAAAALATEAERTKFLDEIGRDQPALRAQLAVLLEAHEKAGHWLDEPAAELTDCRSTVVLDERPGTVVAGRYKLLEQIGEGGMGTVWVAEQRSPVKRAVALKVVKAGMDSKSVLARFESERQALALMDHPHIAKVLDGGVTDRGRPFFVMELVKGIPLTEYCDSRRLPVRERLEVFVQICAAVQHAHQKGIIHRDLKPSNILVAEHDGRPAPKVIDFGLAKAMTSAGALTDRTLHTNFGTAVGTPLYMAPEQVGINALDLDTRTDVYALGVILYELLTGSTPLEKRRFKDAVWDEIRRVIREEEPPRPSARLSDSHQTLASISAQRHVEPAQLTKLIRGELDWIAMKALEKDRNRRYDSPNMLAQDVRRHLADEPVEACPPTARYRLQKFARRNRGRLSAAAFAIFAVTVMAASIGWAVRDAAARKAESEQAEIARLTAVQGQARASLEAARSLLGDDKSIAAHAKLTQARAQIGNDAPALAELAADVAAAETELEGFQKFLDLIDRAHQKETAPLIGSASAPRAGAAADRMGGRRPELAVPLLLEALAIFGIPERDDWTGAMESGFLGRRQIERVRRLAYEELLWLADDILRRQRAHDADGKLAPEVAARRARDYLAGAERAHRPTRAFHSLRARAAKVLGDEAAAQADARLAEATPATIALDHSLAGQSAYDAKRLADSVRAFEAALRLEPTRYWSLVWLGSCLCDLGQEREARTGAVRVFTGCILNRPDHAHAYFCRANAYFRLQQYEEAVADYSKAIELDPTHAQSRGNRGVAYARLDRLDLALADQTKTIELDPKLAMAWINRGFANSNLGRPDQAVADASKAIELDATYANAWNSRAVARIALGQWDKAVADAVKAVELDPSLAAAWSNLSHARLGLGQLEKSLADSSKAVELDPKSAQAWVNLGSVHSRLGRWDQTLADSSKAIELDPKMAKAWNNRGLALNSLGRPEEAVADFSRAVELNPRFALAWYNRGVAFIRSGKPEKAVEDFTRAAELNPKDARIWVNRGGAHLMLNQPAIAAGDLTRAIELDPRIAIAWYNRGLAYNKLDRSEAALADFTKALELEPGRADAWGDRGVAHVKLGRYDLAIADGLKSVKLAPASANNWNTLGTAQYRAGDWKGAAASLEKAAELASGGDSYDLFYLAMARRKIGQTVEAVKAYEQAIARVKKNAATLQKDAKKSDQLRRLQAETEDVLGLKKN
ncbi:MAG TPA: tetratricopeptide repeat protein [Planctomycetia bacterium]|nr:tetratricopeptide repeat protein [Planctomycetia bacterium]